MDSEFIQALAKKRAQEIFDKEFFENCTDSWYFNEMTEFESSRHQASEEEISEYMKCLSDLFDKYQDSYFTKENAMCAYGAIINQLREVVDRIEVSGKRYKAFECDEKILQQLKDVGNYFVKIYNRNL